MIAFGSAISLRIQPNIANRAKLDKQTLCICQKQSWYKFRYLCSCTLCTCTCGIGNCIYFVYEGLDFVYIYMYICYTAIQQVLQARENSLFCMCTTTYWIEQWLSIGCKIIMSLNVFFVLHSPVVPRLRPVAACWCLASGCLTVPCNLC